MAFSNFFVGRKRLLKVKSYSINQVLGQGAFGVIYKGSDGQKNNIAAKQIDGNIHPRVLTQDLDRLMKLDHPNLMKIFDVAKKKNIVWMIMPLCEQGDLDHFYRKRNIFLETKVDIMKQIAA